jgi:biotin transport system substrate-specific component
MELVNGYVAVRHRYHEWRYNLDFARKAMLALGFACLVGLLAQVRIPLGFTEVPLTGQTFGVLLAGVALGTYWGGASMLMYVGIGALGVPWFTGMNGGIEWVAGATGGYLVGFIAVALAVGWFTERRVENRRVRLLLPAMLLSAMAILLMGTVWLAISQGYGIGEAFIRGFLPFIGLDVAKAVAATGLGSAMTTKQRYGPEL